MSEDVKKEFTVDMGYPGYVFVGWAKGQFKSYFSVFGWLLTSHPR